MYYRLKQTDYDGTFTYSDVVEVRFLNDGQYRLTAKPYPNPTVDILNVQLESSYAGPAVLQILSESGQRVASWDLLLQNGLNHTELNVEQLATGRYVGEVLVSPRTGSLERLTAFRFGIYR